MRKTNVFLSRTFARAIHARKGCPGVFVCPGASNFRLSHYIIPHRTIFVKYYFQKFFRTYVRIRVTHTCARVSVQGRHQCVWDGHAVRQGWTYVLVAATQQLDVRPGWTGVYQLRTPAGWTFVCQLETAAAVRPGKTLVCELQPLGLHNKLTNWQSAQKFSKFDTNFCVKCQLTFLKNCDIIYIENLRKVQVNVYG